MNARSGLPSFFVIGAQKAGTSTLHTWLSRQPDASLPTIKETHFFCDDDKFSLGPNWYRNQFKKISKTAVVGEIDPEYLFYENSAIRIRSLIENPKLIIVLRSPLERAYSHYLMSVQRGLETLSFTQALKEETNRLMADKKNFSKRHHSYMARSRYTEQILRFQTIFPSAEFMYLKFEDLFHQDSCNKIYRQICGFIGIQSEPIRVSASEKINKASATRFGFLQRLVRGKSNLRKIIRPLIYSEQLRFRIKNIIDSFNRAPLLLDIKWREMVPNQFWAEANSEILKLEALTGLELSTWLNSKPTANSNI